MAESPKSDMDSENRTLRDFQNRLVLLASISGCLEKKEFFIERDDIVADCLQFSLKMRLGGDKFEDVGDKWLVIYSGFRWEDIHWVSNGGLWIRNIHLQVVGYRWWWSQ
jgi:hypothetical protein